jgi:hypothetical protein
MTVRTIARKLSDIADAAWDEGDRHPEGGEYGEYGSVANRRIDRRMARLERQIKDLAMVAIEQKYRLSPEGKREVTTSPNLEHILASALIGDWAEVEAATVNARAISSAFWAELHAQATVNFQITLEPRDPNSPLNYKCCGGLKPAHTSNCRGSESNYRREGCGCPVGRHAGWCLNK